MFAASWFDALALADGTGRSRIRGGRFYFSVSFSARGVHACLLVVPPGRSQAHNRHNILGPSDKTMFSRIEAQVLQSKQHHGLCKRDAFCGLPSRVT